MNAPTPSSWRLALQNAAIALAIGLGVIAAGGALGFACGLIERAYDVGRGQK